MNLLMEDLHLLHICPAVTCWLKDGPHQYLQGEAEFNGCFLVQKCPKRLTQVQGEKLQ